MKINTKFTPSCDLNFISLLNDCKVGIMGGSFNPPHIGHLHLARTAIKKLNLNFLIWLISPGNPLKTHTPNLPRSIRKNLCLDITKHDHKIIVSDFEYFINNRYTYKSVSELSRRFANNKLVWVMGEDNLYSLDRFYNWKNILKFIPLVVVARKTLYEPNYTHFSSFMQKMPTIYNKFYIKESQIYKIWSKLPSWTFIKSPSVLISSTNLRNNTKEYCEK